jgi:tRNA threonylcarbamoyladenosine biosynthesis protein TsaB
MAGATSPSAMTSLREVLAAHAPVLLLDAASSVIHVAWLEASEPARWTTVEAEAGTGVFQGIERLGVEVGRAGAFVFCEGPGSILGIRTVAMALRTWCVLQPRPVFAYKSIAVVAEALADPGVGVIVDARRDSWHHFQLGGGLKRVSTADLPPAGRYVTPAHFRNWSPLPADVTSVPYVPSELLAKTMDAPLFRPVDQPDAFLHEEPSYLTWTPQVHRAPPSR